MSSPVESNPPNDASPLRSSSALLAVFKKAAEADGGDILSKSAFTVLVRNLLAPTKSIPKPSDEDLAVAFTMADEDMSGGVDAFEVHEVLRHISYCFIGPMRNRFGVFASVLGCHHFIHNIFSRSLSDKMKTSSSANIKKSRLILC